MAGSAELNGYQSSSTPPDAGGIAQSKFSSRSRSASQRRDTRTHRRRARDLERRYTQEGSNLAITRLLQMTAAGCTGRAREFQMTIVWSSIPIEAVSDITAVDDRQRRTG